MITNVRDFFSSITIFLLAAFLHMCGSGDGGAAVEYVYISEHVTHMYMVPTICMLNIRNKHNNLYHIKHTVGHKLFTRAYSRITIFFS